jgi:hypothetical protein
LEGAFAAEGAALESLVWPLSRPSFFVFRARAAGVFLAEGAAPCGGVDFEGLCLGLGPDLTMVAEMREGIEVVEATTGVKKVMV